MDKFLDMTLRDIFWTIFGGVIYHRKRLVNNFKIGALLAKGKAIVIARDDKDYSLVRHPDGSYWDVHYKKGRICETHNWSEQIHAEHLYDALPIKSLPRQEAFPNLPECAVKGG